MEALLLAAPGTDHPWFLIFAVGAGAILAIRCAYWLCALRRAREGARRFIWNAYAYLAALYLFGVATMLLFHTGGHDPLAPVAFLMSAVFAVGGIVYLRKLAPPRKRYIPKRIRKAVIARDLGNTPFDSSRHHMDHIWPFARGGSHTVDNLRVIAKKRNLQKGAKRPRFREIW